MNEIKAVMDLQEYIASGEYNGDCPPIYLQTATLSIKALEKQIPKKLQQTKDGSLACECGLVVQVKNKTNCLYYCHSCGQKIDWCK